MIKRLVKIEARFKWPIHLNIYVHRYGSRPKKSAILKQEKSVNIFNRWAVEEIKIKFW